MKVADMSIAGKVSAVAVLVIVLLLGTSITVLTGVASRLIGDGAIGTLKNQTALVKLMMATNNANLNTGSQRLLNTFSSYFPQALSVRNEAGVAVPKLLHGTTELNKSLAEVDKFTAITDAVATLFVRSGDDFIRISTSLKNAKGERAMGTLLAREHPALAKLLAGQEYTGPAKLFGKDYMTAYRPLLNAQREVIGAMFVGSDFTEGMAALKQSILSIKLGETGYFYALETKPGKDYGALMIHPSEEGAVVLASKDASGREYIKEMLEKKEGLIRYPWLDKDGVAREKVIAYTYFPDWQWVVAGGSYSDEFIRDSRTLRNYNLIGGIVLLAALALVLVLVLRRMVGQPLAQVIRHFDAIGAGNYSNRIVVSARDEVGRLLAALQDMQTNLRNRITRDQEVANAAMRVKIALDNVSTGVMIADTDRQIIYTNKSVQHILGLAQSAIRQQQPDFDASHMVGQDMRCFHDDPACQQQVMSGQPYATQMVLGERQLSVVTNPVVNDAGERLGVVVEWTDRTIEVQVEREVADIVASASAGNLSKRINMAGKEGFFASLGEGMNQLLGNTQAALDNTSEVLARVAKGDLTHKIETQYQGIFGKLKDDTNATVEQLKAVVGQITEATEAIHLASGEIAEGNQHLASRTEEQASGLEEAASSMEELNSTVKQNAENAGKANALAIDSNQIARKGGEIVQHVVTTMSDIQTSSRKIADIVGVIDSIAFQTNILALNAAVEAARAGESGRGFAVVAAEVRNLAQRSATAAKEIKSLITDSVGKVDLGAKLVGEAGTTMEEVVDSFRQVADLVTEIAQASREQSEGIGQVTQAITQIDEVTQQNAALVEEASAAAEGLKEQAGVLAQSVAVFRLS